LELVVLLASFKYFFVEGGEQFIVGFQTSKKIGLKSTIRITIIGIISSAILFFVFFHYRFLIPTKYLELLLGITLLYFSFRMFKEATEREEKDDDVNNNDDDDNGTNKDLVAYRYGYIYLVTLESIENSSALAALTFVDIHGALVGTIIAVALFVILAVKSKRTLSKIPISKIRLISGILLALTAIPLILYSFGLGDSSWMHWIIPPLG
jgi:uncharacterized membrane protein